MKHFILIFLFSVTLLAQPNTEVFLFDMDISENGMNFSNKQNISNDEGYDNQPFFHTNDLLLFAGNNNGQTDIAQYNIHFKKKSWYKEETGASEYSPQSIPRTEDILAVHLDTMGVQELYRHEATGKKKVILPGLRVAYFTIFDEHTIIASVLAQEGLDLVIADLKNNKADTLLKSSGRSLHKIPGTSSFSYTIENEEGNQDLYLLDMKDPNRASYFICQLPIGILDYVWLNDTQLLLGSGTALFMYDTLSDPEWIKIASLDLAPFTHITRLAVSPDGSKLALVVE